MALKLLYTRKELSHQSLLWVETSSGARIFPSVGCTSVTQHSDQAIFRRTGHYEPPIWKYDFVQSLKSKFVGEAHGNRASELKENVKMMLEDVEDSLSKLELDGYNRKTWNVFMKFKDGSGNFKACLCEDTKGLLCLYEASYLSMEGETILDEAREFTTKALKETLQTGTDQDLATLVNHALDQPLHWRVPKVEARGFIDAYKKRLDANPTLLELAKLDFNIVKKT
ncbi:hypothetical protein RJ639_024392 [Escallonia herrerae]|uniref:Terpene synthase N-terminal domain-containing protein n=1 Tax=Escallonia herrerae TaxID=1293975 RepID=A0AA88UZH6_9ASTE|nr:hypothetical protein RJ639_024392 [Escallonia herrerae]